ncbi:hypothetical protein B4129_1107 [Bacillus safensis]|nr:hypothetical protein B4129_1107 [Bacillus safensis]KIL10504.1 hypothetical protein B4107_1057 [Bacillus safensis]
MRISFISKVIFSLFYFIVSILVLILTTSSQFHKQTALVCSK